MASWLRRRRERPLDCLRLGAAMMWSIPTVQRSQMGELSVPAHTAKRNFHARKACVWYGKQKRSVKEAISSAPQLQVSRHKSRSYKLLHQMANQPVDSESKTSKLRQQPSRRQRNSFASQDNCRSATSIAFNKPRALFSVSSYSLAGTLSATMPAPACR